TSPGATSKSTPRTARMSPNRFSRPCTRIAAAGVFPSVLTPGNVTGSGIWVLGKNPVEIAPGLCERLGRTGHLLLVAGAEDLRGRDVDLLDLALEVGERQWILIAGPWRLSVGA